MPQCVHVYIYSIVCTRVATVYVIRDVTFSALLIGELPVLLPLQLYAPREISCWHKKKSPVFFIFLPEQKGLGFGACIQCVTGNP